jgi:hypothetical protein
VFVYYQGDKLIQVSSTRNGLTPVSRAQLFKKFKGLEIDECPFVNLPEAKSGRWRPSENAPRRHVRRHRPVAFRARAARDDAEACGTSPGAVGASLRTGLFVPAEDAQGAEGVPPARPALAPIRLDRHPAGVPGLERPPAIAVAL